MYMADNVVIVAIYFMLNTDLMCKKYGPRLKEHLQTLHARRRFTATSV